jgi:hypothetical protein
VTEEEKVVIRRLLRSCRELAPTVLTRPRCKVCEVTHWRPEAPAHHRDCPVPAVESLVGRDPRTRTLESVGGPQELPPAEGGNGSMPAKNGSLAGNRRLLRHSWLARQQ